MTHELLQRSQALREQLIAWRRDLHRHPELGFEEVRTADVVARHLRSLGIETITGVGKTGVVGIIEGSAPGPTVLLRFDMDALPIQEETGLPFASENPGVMHACGHDGHTAIGMGVATLLVDFLRTQPGRVKLLFQPAEEGMGGAKATIADGVLEHPKPDVAFALHLWNQMPVGLVAAQPGPLMAAADRFSILLTGHGGHGAQPHTTVDAVHVGALTVNALHTIVSRNLPPQETAVLSVGSFHAGSAYNVIAEQAELQGTLRTFKPEVRQRLLERMEAVLEGMAAAHGITYRLEIDDNVTPAVINDATAAELAAQTARALFGAEAVRPVTPLMVAEDMAEILNKVPGCYLLLGARPAGGARGPHHNPRFDFEEEVLPAAVALLTGVALRYLAQHAPT
ncbi:MAG: amidohydrolase [Caldilineae bacterium]|nr:MAG: amidohydrolase [Caldilineae bacterium]